MASFQVAALWRVRYRGPDGPAPGLRLRRAHRRPCPGSGPLEMDQAARSRGNRGGVRDSDPRARLRLGRYDQAGTGARVRPPAARRAPATPGDRVSGSLASLLAHLRGPGDRSRLPGRRRRRARARAGRNPGERRRLHPAATAAVRTGSAGYPLLPPRWGRRCRDRGPRRRRAGGNRRVRAGRRDGHRHLGSDPQRRALRRSHRHPAVRQPRPRRLADEHRAGRGADRRLDGRSCPHEGGQRRRSLRGRVLGSRPLHAGLGPARADRGPAGVEPQRLP